MTLKSPVPNCWTMYLAQIGTHRRCEIGARFFNGTNDSTNADVVSASAVWMGLDGSQQTETWLANSVRAVCSLSSAHLAPGREKGG